jgi:hypothetical protein
MCSFAYARYVNVESTRATLAVALYTWSDEEGDLIEDFQIIGATGFDCVGTRACGPWYGDREVCLPCSVFEVVIVEMYGTIAERSVRPVDL